MTEHDTNEPGIDPIGDAGLALMSLRQIGSADPDYLRRIEAGLNHALSRLNTASEDNDNLRRSLREQEERVNGLRTSYEERGEQIANLQRQMREFREQVRDVAIREAEEQGWCDDGLNEVLKELGLPPKKVDVEYEVTVKEKGYREGTITVTVEGATAMSDGEAEDKARELAYQAWQSDSSDIDWDEWETDEASDEDYWDVSEA